MSSAATCTLEVQGRVVKATMTLPDVKRAGGGTRGNVLGFSARSRGRLLERFARMEKAEAENAVFLTLTYGQRWPDAAEAKRHLDTFLKRLVRHLPDVSGVWRIEPQKRGAPHYHIVLFGTVAHQRYRLRKEWCAENWGAVIGAEYADHSEQADGLDYRPPFTRIERIHSFRGLMFYVAKYMGKVSEPLVSEAQDARAASAAPDTGFNTVPYLTGRQWGCFNRECLPLAEVRSVVVQLGKWCGLATWRARLTWDGIDPDGLLGWKVFADSAEDAGALYDHARDYARDWLAALWEVGLDPEYLGLAVTAASLDEICENAEAEAAQAATILPAFGRE